MTTPTSEQLTAALSTVIDPEIRRPITEIGMVKSATVDPDGFHAECVQGRHMGFDGKTLIHPSQVEDANTIWAPSEAAITEARDLIATFDAAIAEGKGVVTFNGRMIENLHVANAQRILAVADAIAARQA